MHDSPPDPVTQPENLIYRCRLLSVWRDGPFLTFVIPTMHSRANLSKDESLALLKSLGVSVTDPAALVLKKTQPKKTQITHRRGIRK